MYTYKGYKFYLEDGTIVIEAPGADGAGEYIEEVPTTLIHIASVRKAIYFAYVNFGDVYVGTIYKLIREQASNKDLIKIEKIVNKNGDSIYNY